MQERQILIHPFVHATPGLQMMVMFPFRPSWLLTSELSGSFCKTMLSIISQGGPLCLAVGRLSRAVNQDWTIIPDWNRVMEAPCHDSVVKGKLWLCECVREFYLSGRSKSSWQPNNTLKRSVDLKHSGLMSIMSEVAHHTEEAARVAVTFVWLSYIYFDLFWSRE